MAKKFEPAMGYPMADLLEGLETDLEELDGDEKYTRNGPYRFANTASVLRVTPKELEVKWNDIFDDKRRWNPLELTAFHIRHLLNNDICATGDQFDDFTFQMNLSSIGDESLEVNWDRNFILLLTIVANSFRLECKDCLNAHCDKRDPDFPIEQVQARLVQIKSKKDSSSEFK